MNLEIMYQDKYVGDILMAPKLKWIRDVFKLDYFKYIPLESAKLLLPAGLDSTWTVIGPSHATNNWFTFKFV
ncbi:hypothetical protein PIB30_056554 [Stylosanthes scabra]|uniref:Uncharacterized protein n=1 Tax=Stylosanthes scabra TaxID=79078 RepID=A0ABU6WJE1_9FABA|nr:hypothetical protein [Stylosanthes scabra]